MIRHWFYFIVHSVLILTVLTNTAYAHTTKIMPMPYCSCMEKSPCCKNNASVEQYIATSANNSICSDDCNSDDCSSQSQHQPALLTSFSFQSIHSTEILISVLCHSPHYYHEPLLKPPMA